MGSPSLQSQDKDGKPEWRRGSISEKCGWYSSSSLETNVGGHSSHQLQHRATVASIVFQGPAKPKSSE